MSTGDHELMHRLRDGDVAAFEQLVDRWEGKVTGLLLRLVPERSEVEDLRQEAFLRVYTGRRRYRSQGAFSTWLFRIVLNLARDAARRRRRRGSESLAGKELVDSRESQAARIVRSEMSETVRRAVTALPVKLQEVLILKHYGELSFAQIAEVLGEPVGTVKSRMQRALRALHAELARRGINETD